MAELRQDTTGDDNDSVVAASWVGLLDVRGARSLFGKRKFEKNDDEDDGDSNVAGPFRILFGLLLLVVVVVVEVECSNE